MFGRRPPALPLDGKVVLITGAAQGIGRQTALGARTRGARVVAIDLPSAALDALRAELGEGHLVHAGDVTDAAGMRTRVQETCETLGGIDVVVANAGIERVGPMWQMAPEEFERVVNVNALGVYRTIQPALPTIMARKGHVTALCSVSACVPWPLCAAYGASKAFVGSLMRSLRVEFSASGATAGAMYFGFIKTDMMKRATDAPGVDALFERTPSIVVSRAPLTPEAAAERVLRGIETRAGVGFSHFGVKVAMGLRGLIELNDDRLSRDLDIPSILAEHYPD